MDITLGYAIAAGGVLILIVLINLIPCLVKLVSSPWPFIRRFLKYLIYPYLIRQNRFLGSWTLADIIIQLLYIGSNSVCLGYKFPPIASASERAGTLSLINLIPVFLGPHLSFLADIFGVPLSAFRYMHRSAGLMATALVLFHTVVMVTAHSAFALSGSKNLSAVIGGSSLGLIIVLSWPPLRRHVYEIFLRLHQALAAIVAISTLLHAPSTLFPRLYFYIAFGIFMATSAAEGWFWLCHNGFFSYGKHKKMPRVEEIFKYSRKDDDSPIQLTILPKEPLEMEAGQYINIWIPSLGLRYFMQSHPFVVASWTGKKQTKLELIIQPRHGWTKKLHSRAISASGQSGGLGRVLLSGPHGVPVSVGRYEYVLMVASGYGIIAQLPLLERLVQGTLAREVRARRIRLVWEFDDMGLYDTVYPLLNWVLVEDRKLGINCALEISLYTTRFMPAELGQRAQILKPPILVKKVFDEEVAEVDERKRQEEEAVKKMEKKRTDEISRGRGEIISEGREQPDKETDHKLSSLPVCTREPRMIITVSASGKIRNGLRSALGTSLNKEITLAELDFQPSD